MSADVVEERTQQLGRALLAAASAYRPGPAERMQDWLLAVTAGDERFRGRLLRYLDVLASLDHDSGGAETKRLAAEYFGEDFPGLPRGLRWLLRLARDEHVPARVVGESSRRAAELFARRFITPAGGDGVGETARWLGRHGRLPSFDLLGEAVLSEREADAYVARYLELIEGLAGDPAAGEMTAGGVFALQVSLKLSSLTAHFTPVDPEGTIARARPPLEAIVEAAERSGIGVTVDMEQFEYRDLTWELFTRTFARGERFGGWPGAGIVLQAYLRAADRHADELVAFVRSRGAPVQVRLVKGAYWDYENIVARAASRETPVFTQKSATDAAFERILARLVGRHPALLVAVGSHNARAHALAEALREAAGLPDQAVEHQTLFRTAEGLSRALARLGWAARDYVPSGELLPGMAYLVRRVLENSSQAGILQQGRAGAPPGELLRPPPASPGPEPSRPAATPGAFTRAPEARWFDPGFREAFETALAETRQRWGERLPLRAGGAALPPAETRVITSPSHPGSEPVGVAEFAGVEATRRAVASAASAAAGWAATPVAERAAVLLRAADLLYARGHEFAAWVVHEGGRERSGAWTEVEEAVDFLRYYAAQAEELFGAASGRIAPRGVVAVIPPWNFPLAIPCGMTAAALASGNAVVLKPAEQTPLLGGRLAALLHEAGVPDDALIALPGRGETAGRELAESPDVQMVAFTGSRAVGTELHEIVARVEPSGGARTKTLVAEMGGKNAVLVFSDADPDEVVDGVMRSAFGHANQKCSAASRVLVTGPAYGGIRDRLVDAARSLRIGSADAPGTQVNPVIDREALQRLRRDAGIARDEGEVLLDRLEERAAGGGSLVLGPLIVELPAAAAASARTATEELFGPILALIPCASEEEAYALANGTDYGLTAGIYSRSPATIARAARALQAGNVYANRAITAARVGVEPFGGMKMSGTGPKAGGADYLWGFVRRTDLPADGAPRPGGSPEAGPRGPVLPSLPWDAPLERRIEVVERAAVILADQGRRDGASALLSAAQAARRELARPQPTIPVAGQSTELRYDTPRGLGLLHAAGPEAAWWLAAPLLAGNGLALFDAPALAPAVEALLRAGAPEGALRVAEGLEPMLLSARRPEVSFAASDGGPALARALHGELGETAPGQRSLKALISRLDGPQAGEPGFVRRFCWPRVVAVRTLRHGAELGFGAARRPGPARGGS